MWIMTQDGFYSAVQNRENTEGVVIRARVRKDLETLTQKMATGEILENLGTDYRYRVFASKQDWKQYLQRATEEIDYSNFKNRIHEIQGNFRASVYLKIWTALLSLQPIY